MGRGKTLHESGLVPWLEPRPDLGPGFGPDLGPDLSPDHGPDPGPDSRLSLGPDYEPYILGYTSAT